MFRSHTFFRVILVFAAFAGTCLGQGSTFNVQSPDKKTRATIDVKETLLLSITHNNQLLLLPSPFWMEFNGHPAIGRGASVRSVDTRSVHETIVPVVAEKRKIIPDEYNELTLRFKQDFVLKVRAYDDGVAYRFFTSIPGEVTVKHEEVALHFPSADSAWFPLEDSFLSHSERQYFYMPVNAMPDTQMSILPLLVSAEHGIKIAFTEADLLDYPGLYLRSGGKNEPVLKSVFPAYPLAEELQDERTVRVSRRADYIARTQGTREFPWRVFVITERDGALIENDIVYRLGSPSKLKDTGWIRPGKVAWDWWNANNITNVNFRAGINTDTYKYYIDFASRYGIEYIILDEGWSKTANLFQINPEMNIEELFAYAAQKKVGIIPWVNWKALDDSMGAALDRFQAWGARGIKVDFMQRDDQKMVNYYEKVAIEAAKRHLMVDFHGAYKPTGLSRTYPNVVTREGVRGLEHNKWSEDITPEHDVTLPFTRMLAGAMDFTPGAMRNAIKSNFRIVFTQPMSQGTRCHQLAMYIVYESPLQMLSDVPSSYYTEPDAMEFLGPVPTVWDETRVLDAKVADYVLVARKHGDEWYLGAMTDWTPRTLHVDMRFLPPGEYELLQFADGPNADRNACDFVKSKRSVSPSDVVAIQLAPGGGWAGRIQKKQ